MRRKTIPRSVATRLADFLAARNMSLLDIASFPRPITRRYGSKVFGDMPARMAPREAVEHQRTRWK